MATGERGTYGNDTLISQRLDLRLPIVLPVADIVVGADTERSAGENDGADVIIKAGRLDSLLVGLGSTSLLGEDETCADPDGGCT